MISASAAFAAALAWAGAAVAYRRLWPSRPPAEAPPGDLPFVSIIVPARNEERNLPPLLASLKNIDYPSYEVIVVDDHSTDGTAAIAEAAGVVVMQGAALPPGWNGKNWVCRQAARRAQGDYLLFTDADTVHRRDGLKRAVAFMRARNADLISCLPYHKCPTWWEKLTGPFHALLLLACAPKSPKPRRLFAIGQFLLFETEFYRRCGGHEAVASQYPDDLALANLCLQKGGVYAVHDGPPIFDVRMYATFREFLSGWRRNFQAGLRQSKPAAGVETVLAVAALLGAGRPHEGPLFFVPSLLVLGLILARQRAWGEFSIFGVLLFPVSLALHMAATGLALLDWIRGGRLKWKDRELTQWTAAEEKAERR